MLVATLMRGTVYTTNRWLRWFALALAALGTYWAVSLYLGGPSGFAPIVVVLVGTLAWGLYAGGRRPTRVSFGNIDVRDEGIFVNERHVVQRRHVRLRAPFELRNAHEGLLRTTRGDVTLSLDQEPIGPLVDVLIKSWRMRSCFRAFARPRTPVIGGIGAYLLVLLVVYAVAALVVGSSSGFAMPIAVPTAFPLTILALQLARRRDVTIGADGIEVRSHFGGTRRIPYSQIVGAKVGERFPVTVVVDVRDEEPVRLDAGMFGGSQPLTNLAARSLVSLVERARVAWLTAAAARGEAAALLARSGRPVAEWLQAIASVGERQASFRTAALSDEQLWRAVADASQPETVRAAAAVALRVSLDDEGRQRLRVAADACVAPKLRAALDAVADAEGDAHALETALGEVEDAPPRAADARARPR